jgi:excinuclease UvrABC nuclease subunit
MKQVLNLTERSEDLFFLQRLRDEAHRFAVSSAKLRHDKIIKNFRIFDKIEGLGGEN